MPSPNLELTVISNSPGPNQSDFYQALAGESGIDLTVYYCAKSDKKWHNSEPKQVAYRTEFMINCMPSFAQTAYLYCNPKVLPVIARSSGLVFIQGYAYPTALAALWACIALNRPFVIWGEMIDRRHGKSALLKRCIVWPALRRAAAVLTMGDRAITSYKNAGVPENRIYQVPYSCNLDRYLSVPRGQLGSTNRRRKIVVTAQLIARKRIDVAIQAFVPLAAEFDDWDLVICGDGPCRKRLQGLVPESLRNRISFLGFVPKSRQPEIYAHADLLLITSGEDGWGMVVPEAMAAGLPIVSTNRVESSTVLLSDGKAGFVVPVGDTEATTLALRRLMTDGPLRASMGEAARRKAIEYDCRAVSRRCVDILNAIWQQRPAR